MTLLVAPSLLRGQQAPVIDASAFLGIFTPRSWIALLGLALTSAVLISIAFDRWSFTDGLFQFFVSLVQSNAGSAKDSVAYDKYYRY